MIARHWRGWTTPENADAYEAFLNHEIFPGLRRIAGYRGGYLLRNDAASTEVEFLVLNFFDSLESVKQFAGPDYTVAVFEPEALRLLLRIEPHATHYQVRADTTPRPTL